MENLHKPKKKKSKRKYRPEWTRERRKEMAWSDNVMQANKRESTGFGIKSAWSNIYGIYDMKCDARYLNADQSRMFRE